MSPTESTATTAFEPTEAFARHLDEADVLRKYRDQFHIPRRPNGEPVIYFAGNSLGLQPKSARAIVEQELDDWAALAVDAHMEARTPWYSYHEVFRDTGERLVGALPGAGEVVMMNSLTINLHLMLVSFYRPGPQRRKILMEHPVFPSDLYAVRTHLRSRGLDPDDTLVQIKPRDGEHTIRTEDIEGFLDEQGEQIALVLLPGVNFYTGQVFDMARIAAAARQHGCAVGFQLAHGAGNVPMRLHEWDVDFAIWCSYKYLNAGPGAVAGCFVHEKHANAPDLHRFAGWWGDDPQARFQMHLKREFIPQPGAAGWQVSNPPVLCMAPLQASLQMFDEIGMDTLRHKSKQLTGYLRFLLDRSSSDQFEIITPHDPDAQGCQLSMMVHDQPKDRHQALLAEGAICDLREPNIIRAAPAPLFNTFHEVWRFAQIMTRYVQANLPRRASESH